MLALVLLHDLGEAGIGQMALQRVSKGSPQDRRREHPGAPEMFDPFKKFQIAADDLTRRRILDTFAAELLDRRDVFVEFLEQGV